MKVFHGWPDSPLPASHVTIGGFDGVHRGHQALIRHTVDAAHQAGLLAVVVTFQPAPAVFFRRRPPRYLTPLREKLPLLEALDVDVALVLSFDEQLARTPARVFVEALRRHLGMQALTVGAGFALGHQRQGTTERLQAWAAEMGYRFEVFPPVTEDGQRISASRIRALLDEGRVEEAARLLGRWYTLAGRVRAGEGRGSGVGFPTANILPPEDKWLPALGVYAGWALWEGRDAWHPAVANFGRRPTFGELPTPLLEVHLLNFQGDLYERNLTFAFVRRLRGEKRFPSVEALRAQIDRDIQQAQEVLEHAGHPTRVHPLHP